MQKRHRAEVLEVRILMIGKHLKDYKKAYVNARKAEPRGVRIGKNSDWRKRWMPFIKYDHDFDGGFFIELIVHKLHIMLDYYDHGKYCMQVDESRLEIVESLKEACRLGDMILEDKFEDTAHDIMMEHHHMWTVQDDERKNCARLEMEWDSPENEALYEKASKAGEEFRERTIAEFFDYIGKHYREWWD